MIKKKGNWKKKKKKYENVLSANYRKKFLLKANQLPDIVNLINHRLIAFFSANFKSRVEREL